MRTILAFSSFLLHLYSYSGLSPLRAQNFTTASLPVYYTQNPSHLSPKVPVCGNIWTRTELGKKTKKVETRRKNNIRVRKELWFFHNEWSVRKLKLGLSQSHVMTATKMLQRNTRQRTASRRLCSLNTLDRQPPTPNPNTHTLSLSLPWLKSSCFHFIF